VVTRDSYSSRCAHLALIPQVRVDPRGSEPVRAGGNHPPGGMTGGPA